MDDVELVLKDCGVHLDTTGTRNTAIEAYLVRYLLVRICAERESQIELLVRQRVDRLGDIMVSNFVTRATDRLLRSLYVREIKGFLGAFGSGTAELFDKAVGADAQRRWDDIVANRHAVGHTTTAVSLTLSELEDRYTGSKGVMESVKSSLGL